MRRTAARSRLSRRDSAADAMIRPALVLSLALLAAPPLQAQQGDETLADIRQELAVLLTEVQKLKRELSTTGAPGTNLAGTSALSRIDAMEAELGRLTNKTEEMEHRITRVVEDGTNRIGDLEFRICEVEPGCDVGKLGETLPLGGGSGGAGGRAAPAPRVEPGQGGGGPELAVGEQADFDRAKEALDSGSFRSAAELFATFTQTYTGGPLTAQAQFYRGQALAQLGEPKEAARAYLDSFSGQPAGPVAPRALLELGLKLDELGQRPDACVTLTEVTSRFPDSDASVAAQTARASLGCS